MNSKRETYKELNEILKKEYGKDESIFNRENFKAIIENKSKELLSNVYKNEYAKKWLTEIQKENPFIGKSYLSRAYEYETEHEMLENKEIEFSELDEKIVKSILDSDKPFDKNNINDDTLVDEKDDLRYTGNIQNKFIDYCIAVNTIKEIEYKDENELENVILEKIKDFHENENYKPNINLKETINYTKTKLLLTNNKNTKKISKLK